MKKSTSSAEVSPAKTFHAPALEKALKIAMGKLLAADYGGNTRDSLANLGQDGLWQKMSEGCCQQVLISDREEILELFSGTWPTWGMMRNGRVTVLKPLARPTKGKESLSWPTPLAGEWKDSGNIERLAEYADTKQLNLTRLVAKLTVQNRPTPRSREGNAGTMGSAGAKHNAERGYLDGVVLEKEMQNWPTPATRDYKGGRKPETLMKAGRNETNSLNDAINSTIGKTGALNADWVEILMNLPIGWTDIDKSNEDLDEWPGWPAPMNAGQYPYEPPRVVEGQKNRAKRLKCLGNGCVPLQVYPIFKAIMEAEK